MRDGNISVNRSTVETGDLSSIVQDSLLAQGHQSSINMANNVDTVTNGVQQNTAKEKKSQILDAGWICLR